MGADAVSLLPKLDVEVNIFHDLFPTKRKRFKTVAVLTDEPGPATPQLYSDKSEVALDFPEWSRFYKFATQFFKQQPRPKELLYIPVPRTPGFPATDWSDALNRHIEEYGTDFYYLTALTSKPSERMEIANWAAATGFLDGVLFFCSNYAGDGAKINVGTQQVQTLTLDGDLASGQTIFAKFDGILVSEEFNESHLATMQAFAAKIAALDSIASAVVGGANNRVITITTQDAGVDVVISEAQVTGPGTLPTITVAQTTASSGFTIQSRFQSDKGNYDQYSCVKAKNKDGTDKPNATLDVKVEGLATGGHRIVVTPATNASAQITSTYTDVMNRINSDPDSSFLFRAYGKGALTTIPTTASPQAFSGGAANADHQIDQDGKPDVSRITQFSDLVRSNRVIIAYHVKPEDYYTTVGGINAVTQGYYPAAVMCGVGSVRNPGSFTFKNRIPQGVADPTNKRLFPGVALTQTNLRDLRLHNVNTFFVNPVGLDNITDDYATSGLFIDIQMAIDVLTAWQTEELWDLLSQPPGGRGKVPYYDDGFAMIQERIWHTLRRGMLPEWNFIAYDPNTGEPAARIRAPRYIDLVRTDITLIKKRHYPLVWEATFKGAVHTIDVTGYLTAEFIPSSLTAFAVI
jgi:hypothetical protein